MSIIVIDSRSTRSCEQQIGNVYGKIYVSYCPNNLLYRLQKCDLQEYTTIYKKRASFNSKASSLTLSFGMTLSAKTFGIR